MREQIGRVWAAVCEGDAARTVVKVRAHYMWWTERTLVALHVAWVVTPAEVWREAVAFGLTDDEALAALWELVCLHARVRRDEIDAALAAGGARWCGSFGRSTRRVWPRSGRSTASRA